MAGRARGRRVCEVSPGAALLETLSTDALRWRASFSAWSQSPRAAQVRSASGFRRVCRVPGPGRRLAGVVREAPSARCAPCCRLLVLSWQDGPSIREARAAGLRDPVFQLALVMLDRRPPWRSEPKRAQ